MVSLQNLLVGGLIGLMVTIVTTIIWPKKKPLAHFRMIGAPVLGAGVAYLLAMALTAAL